jgi:hypothetical protein
MPRKNITEVSNCLCGRKPTFCPDNSYNNCILGCSCQFDLYVIEIISTNLVPISMVNKWNKLIRRLKKQRGKK